MKKYQFWIVIAFLAAMAVINIQVRTAIFTDVHTGQTWQWVMYKDDPFKDDEVLNVEVLDVRDGYVQYRYLDSGLVSSMRKPVFLAGDATLVGAE